ncbi:MAG TPA: ABC transporter permease [Chitinophagales bacterium]|nr:ABC transporter permease [Chitinophagales bacterium]HNM32835.1 ABC transporter permease [Chitinophagales bacterium]
MATEIKQDYWSYVKRQFSNNKRALYSFYIVVFMAFVALFADFLANEKPIYCQYKGQSYFPIFRDYGVSLGLAKWPKDLLNINWLETTFDKCIRTPIPYSTTNQDFFNSGFVSPFGKQDVTSLRWRHWLGTDDIGRDITAGLIHGTRIAFIVGIISMSIASFIGILLGAIAGFYGDDKIQLSRAAVIMGILFFFIGWFYAFIARSFDLSDAIGDSIFSFLGQLSISLLIFFGALFIGYLLRFILKIIPFFRTKVNIPVDIIVQRMIEILVSIPRLFLIIAVIAISKPGIILIMVIIGLTSWTEIARFIRAELLKVRNLEYIEAADALGYSRWRILFKHAIPNAIAPVLITVAFGIAAAVLIESSLSFLGIGVPAEVVTWGKILAKAQGSKSQLWVAIFPGIAIFLTVTLFNLIGEGLTDALDPRQKK